MEEDNGLLVSLCHGLNVKETKYVCVDTLQTSVISYMLHVQIVESRYILFLGFNKFFSFSVPNFVLDGLLLLTAMVRFVVRGFELKCPLKEELPVEEALFSVLKHCHLWKPTNTTQSLSKVIYNCGHLCVYSCHFPPCSSLYDWLCVMSSQKLGLKTISICGREGPAGYSHVLHCEQL